MRTIYDKTECQNLRNALSKEWLETNGIGGYGCSTIIAANTRRQHGWLVASLTPPTGRFVLVAKFEESATVNDAECYLSTNLYPGTVFPHGFNLQTEFRLRPWPVFRFASRECTLERSVLLVHGENTLVVAYRHIEGDTPVTLKVRPLLAFREYDKLTEKNAKANMTVENGGGELSVQPYEELPRLYFYGDVGTVEARADWYYKLNYPTEQEQGFSYEEDLFSPFELTLRIPVGQTAYVVVSTEKKTGVKPEAIVEAERARRAQFEKETDTTRQGLLVAADAFVAKRDGDQRTILAGFPWFADWGRDVMIALPGLTLNTGRFEDAKKILQMASGYCDRGLIPNLFPDEDEKAEYNSVDAALWFVVAAWKYWKASGDNEGVRGLLPALSDVVKFYRDGTRYDIYADKDGLISAGKAGSQLTWMDVKAEGYVPTPRHGKPVEINALWLNALLMLAEMEENLARDVQTAVILRNLAEQVKASFVKIFWNAADNCLFDVVRDDFKDSAIRPNQIFAVSLPHSPLNAEQQKAVLDVVTQELLTPYGLRSLSPKHEKYCAKFKGNRFQRDCAYHQGTVWPWLIGPYADAYFKVNGTGRPQRKAVMELIKPLLAHLDEAGLGTIPEIFDGSAPHQPAGCFAQAWSVAEVLRVYDACSK